MATDHKTAPPHLVEGDDEILATIGESLRDNPPLFPSTVKMVDALCLKVDKRHYKGCRDPKFRFTFRVIDPVEYAGIELEMHARDGGWKTLPPRSKLWKLARRATGQKFRRGQKVTKSLFVGKLFRCRVRPDREGDYTVIDIILERLAG